MTEPATRPSLRNRMYAGEHLVGPFIALPGPVPVEICGTAGFDFVCIDCEHAQIGRAELENMIRAADLHRLPAMVRVQDLRSEYIASAIDAGAAGVLVPRVSSASEAREAVAAARTPPKGRRGVGPGRRARYGYDIPAAIGTAATEPLLALQIETREGLAAAAEIAAVEGVDLLFVGPGDLSVSLGLAMPQDAARLDAAIREVATAAAAAGNRTGLFQPDSRRLAHFASEGVQLFILSSDAMMLMQALANAAAAARDSLGRAG